MTSEDWLEPEAPPQALVPFEGTPADAVAPGFPVGPQAITAAMDANARRAQLLMAWESLEERQRVFLNTWRECRFNANRALRVLAGTSHKVSKTTVNNWAADANFELTRDMLRSASITEILSKDYLAARQEDIVETLLAPKPILHQGFATGHFEVEAGAAGKANEVLLRLGGHLKDRELEVNVGVIVGPPTLHIQVMPTPPSEAARNESVVIDAKFTEVPDDDWLGA